MSVQASSRLPGPRGGAAVRVLARLYRDPLREYASLVAQYGDAIQFPMGRRSRAFFLSRPEHAQHTLATNQDNYVKSVTYRPLRALIGDGLITSEGERWRQHRKLAQPSFSQRHVHDYGAPMAAAARRLACRWDRLANGSVLDVAPQMSGLTLEVVGQVLFGADLTGDADRMIQAMPATQLVAVLGTLLPLPWGPRSVSAVRMAARRLGRVPEGIDGPAWRIVAGRRAGPASTDGKAPAGELLGALLAAKHGDEAALTDSDVAAEAAHFLLAGHETSANALSWTLALLSAYPAARRQLEEELASVLGDRDPDPDDADKLPWTTAVVSEAMRLYPPIWNLERNALGDDDVAGVAVPAGSLVVISPYLVHRHPEFWPDPAGFDPRRFLPGGAGDPAMRHRYAFIPFGGGKRACIGASFAAMETVLVLATIARRFRLELTPAGIPRTTAHITLRPRGGLPMRLYHR